VSPLALCAIVIAVVGAGHHSNHQMTLALILAGIYCLLYTFMGDSR
jgi:hypothetical protein